MLNTLIYLFTYPALYQAIIIPEPPAVPAGPPSGARELPPPPPPPVLTPPAGFVETMERPSPYSTQRNSATGTKTVRFEKDGLSNVLDELWRT